MLLRTIAPNRTRLLAAITLTVTEANHKAVKLYQDAGFFIRHRFDAMVLDKS